MINEKLVREILGTYELKPQLSERLVGIATRRLNELGINSFDNVYTYIDGLVAAFSNPNRFSRKTLSLDENVYDTSRTTRHEHIEYGSAPSEVKETSITHPNPIFGKGVEYVSEYLGGLLKDRFDDTTFQMLVHLFQRSQTLPFDVTVEKVILSIPRLEEAIDYLSRHYGSPSGVYFLPRTIVHVNSNPFSIKFGKRNFDKNPLAFLRQHERAYTGLMDGRLARGRLAKLDGGLYWSLGHYGQLDEAIPTKRSNGHGEVDVQKVIAAHPLYDGNASEASRNLPYVPQTFLKYWKEAGLPIKKPGQWSKASRDEIIASLKKHNGNQTAVMEELGCSKYAVRKHRRDALLKATGRQFPRRKTQLQKTE